MADPTSPSPYSENKRFEPKVKVELNPPKDGLISLEELSLCDGMSLQQRFLPPIGSWLTLGEQKGTHPDKPTWVAIKGTVFDVSKNAAYQEKGQYHGGVYSPPKKRNKAG